MATEAARVLDEWRLAERLLAVVPSDVPERADVELVLAEMRQLYQRLTTETRESSRARLDSAALQIESTHPLLERIAKRYAQRQPPAPER